MKRENRRDRQCVRDLLSVAIDRPEQLAKFTHTEVDLAIRLVRRARLLGRLAVSARDSDWGRHLSSVVNDQLRSAEVMAESRSRFAMWEIERIAWATRSRQDIPLVLLKGCAYVALELPNARGRSFADVDILTAEPAIEIVEHTLNEGGWQTAELTPYDQYYYRRWTHELPPLVNEEREIEVDLHHNILPRTARVFPPADRLLDRSRQIQGSRYRVLCNEDIALHAIVHLCFDSDFANKLRDLVDIRDLIQHFVTSEEGFWEQLLDRAEELELTRPTYYGLRFANALVGLHLPDAASLRISHWAPNPLAGWTMDALVPRALFPVHPDRRSGATEFVRFLLFVRFHWIRMSPWILAYHLLHKLVSWRRTTLPV